MLTRPSWQAVLFTLISALCVLACDAEAPEPLLQIDIRSDYVPGEDFDSIRVEIGRGDVRTNLEHIVDLGGDYVRGRRVGSAIVGAGEIDVVARMVQNGVVVVSREVSVLVQGDVTVATIVISRACGDVECPAPGGDSVLRSCYGGRCADPRCTVETPAFCPVLCSENSDCTPTGCRVGQCDDGVCFSVPRDGECGGGQQCRTDGVCVTPSDAGPVGSDAAVDTLSDGGACPCVGSFLCVAARCELDSDGDSFPVSSDCDDFDPEVFPGADEICNGRDDDCDFAQDEGLDGASEVCNGIDDDCDGRVDEVPFAMAEVCNGIDDDCDILVDESDVCDGCRGWTYDGHTYLHCPGMTSWRAAMDECSRRGMNSVSVEDAVENIQLAVQLNVVAWLGLNDQVSEGSYVWENGSTSAHTNWMIGEPNDALDEDCVMIRPDGEWNDTACTALHTVLCESSDEP